MDCFALLSQGIAMTNQKSESALRIAMTIWHKITRHCEIFARKSKQSISATYESLENFLSYANLWLDLLIHFSVIYFLYLLKSRDLDCFGLFTKALAMTNKKSESAIRIAMTEILHSTPFTKDAK